MVVRVAKDVVDLPSCGRYITDSWAIFVKRWMDIISSDSNNTDRGE